MLMTEKDYWLLWNQLYDVVGPVRFGQLLRVFGSAQKAWEAPAKAFEELGWGSKVLQKLEISRNAVVVGRNIRGSRSKYDVLTWEESGYPLNLLQMDASPPVLYYRGKFLPQDRTALAVVGSRKMTRYGRDVVKALVPELSMAGLTIVSGLALGVDTLAHKIALESNGRTIAVLPCGIDRVYPRSNGTLAREIVKNGALMTEFPPETPIRRSNFPLRNRIIAGLSLGVLVVEVAERGGTFHTVTAALEQGKEVFVVPGSIFSPYSAGCAKLIEKGAKPVTQASDILGELETVAKN